MGQGTVFCEDEYIDYNHVKASLFPTNTCHAFICQIRIWFSPVEFKPFCRKLPNETIAQKLQYTFCGYPPH